MSDGTPPEKPKPKHYSHLQSEPVPMSFASPQLLAQITAGNVNLFPNSGMKPGFGSMSLGNAGYNKVPVTQTIQSIQQASSSSAAAASSTPSEAKFFKPLPAQIIDAATFKDIQYITLDGLQLDTREVYDTISGTFQWEHFESQDERCVQFIKETCEQKRVFLIASGALAQKVVPQIHELPQVYAIYIYCVSVDFHRGWSKKFDKVRVVTDNDDTHLLPQFAVDVAQANIDWGNGFLKLGNREKAKEKFKLAAEKLNNHARNHDPAIDAEIKARLEECK